MKVNKAKYKFRGGVHPADKKDMSAQAPLITLPLPKTLRVPLVQHLGAPAKPVVEIGAHVKRGDVIGTAGGFISAVVHAPTSGTVKAIEAHPATTGRVVQHVVIEADGLDERCSSETLPPLTNWENVDKKVLVERVAAAGIVGMGGAGFPTHVKLNPPPDKRVHTLIINGAECEPYLTADHKLMVERTADMWQGIRMLRHILGAERVRIAIEENKPDAIDVLARKIHVREGDDVEVSVLETRYPHGSEKQQIYATLGWEVPSGGLPADIGCCVENVGTAVAIYEAVVKGWPLDERVVTVTGEAVAKPRNFIARVGTSVSDLIAAAGGYVGTPGKLIMGGPMMGFAASSPDVSITKTSSGILVLDAKDVAAYTSQPCIGCGRCNRACPLYLLPSEMGVAIEADDVDAAIELNVCDCYECGCCSYVCPAHRPLVQHFRRAKGVIALRKMQEAKK